MKKFDNLISEHTGPLEATIRKFKEEYLRLWEESSTDFPLIEKTYSPQEQESNEKTGFDFFNEFSGLLRNYPRKKDLRKKWQENFRACLKNSGKRMLYSSDINLDVLLTKEFLNSTRFFIDNVNSFDKSFPLSKVYQALRNLWIMNSLQLYLDTGAYFTQPMFAYSMLYPYTDNLNDSTILSSFEKKSFNRKLKQWLEGIEYPCENDHDEKVYALLQHIENHFPRDENPGVYQSLLGIYNAQIRSLSLLNGTSSHTEKEIMDVSFEKGGTSVLADGFLLRGEMNEAQQSWCFGFGTFLQLADDLQDIDEDKTRGHVTLFSNYAGKIPLDGYVNKLINYMDIVLRDNLDNPNGKYEKLRNLIFKSCFTMFMESVSKGSNYFTPQYLEKCEHYIPFRFSYLANLRNSVKEKIIENGNKSYSLTKLSSLMASIAG